MPHQRSDLNYTFRFERWQQQHRIVIDHSWQDPINGEKVFIQPFKETIRQLLKRIYGEGNYPESVLDHEYGEVLNRFPLTVMQEAKPTL